MATVQRGQALRHSASFAVPSVEDPARAVGDWLEALTAQWVGRPSARRAMLAVRPGLVGQQPLEVFAQYDEIHQLLTVEVWSEGRRITGVDDWLG